jgi:transposase
MSFQGKQLPPEIQELVVQLKKHHDQERRSGKFVSTKNSSARTASALGFGLATVKRIMASYSQCGGKVVVTSAKRPGRPPTGTPMNIQPIVRQFIRSENLKGRRVSIKRVGTFLNSEHSIDIPQMTLWRALKRWGFTHGEGRRRDSLKEQDRVILARRHYLRTKRANKNPDGTLKRPEVYVDETYLNKNHSSRFTWYLNDDGPSVNKPSGVGPRLIVVHAVTKDGWIDGAQLVFEAKKRTGDYHGQMNWDNFSRWVKTQLFPNVPPKSIIILDNARYHNVFVDDCFPNKCSSKEQLRHWLTRNRYPWHEDMLKAELLELCSRLSPVPEYKLDRLALEHDFSILRTPPYHPELQPIETCWAVVKNHMADNCDYTMKGMRDRLPEAFKQVTSHTLKEILSKVALQEENYWYEDEKLDDEYTINAEEEFFGQKYFEDEEGSNPYLDDL